MQNKLVIFGASGFVGRNLVRSFESDDYDVLCISRYYSGLSLNKGSISWKIGDLHNPDTWRDYIDKDSIVVNLAFSSFDTEEQALNSAEKMLAELSRRKIKRYIHCSTVSVYGKNKKDIVDETTSCNPQSRYANLKYSVENVVQKLSLEDYDFCIIRPTEVFGPGGRALNKICHNLVNRSRIINYAQSCLYSQRKMHLVPVETLVAAIKFLVNLSQPLNGNIFIISDDNDPRNNFADVENILMNGLGIKPYLFNRYELTSKFLEIVFCLMAKDNIGISSIYSCDKIRKLGFSNPISLSLALKNFSEDWLQMNKLEN